MENTSWNRMGKLEQLKKKNPQKANIGGYCPFEHSQGEKGNPALEALLYPQQNN